MKRNQVMVLAGVVVLLLSACSGEPVRDERYQHVETVRKLDMPPELTDPNKNLIMDFPRPSLKACTKLFEANEKFKVLEQKKKAKEAAEKAKEAAAEKLQSTEK